MEKEVIVKNGESEITGNSVTAPQADASDKKSKTTAPTVSDALNKIGKSILKSNVDMTEVYVTSDGFGFFAKNDAENHARELKNIEIIQVKR